MKTKQRGAAPLGEADGTIDRQASLPARLSDRLREPIFIALLLRKVLSTFKNATSLWPVKGLP